MVSTYPVYYQLGRTVAALVTAKATYFPLAHKHQVSRIKFMYAASRQIIRPHFMACSLPISVLKSPLRCLHMEVICVFTNSVSVDYFIKHFNAIHTARGCWMRPLFFLENIILCSIGRAYVISESVNLFLFIFGDHFILFLNSFKGQRVVNKVLEMVWKRIVILKNAPCNLQSDRQMQTTRQVFLHSPSGGQSSSFTVSSRPTGCILL